MKAITITRRKDHSRILGIGLLITTIILSFAILNPLHAQTKIGLRAGISISEPGLETELGNTTDLTKSFTGVDIAVVSEFPIANRLSLQAELGYAEKGIRLATSTSINVLGVDVPLEVRSVTKLHQIELPILAKYQLSKGMVKSYAMVGATLGYTMSGKITSTGTVLSMSETISDKLDFGNQNRWSGGAIGGLGIELDKGPGTLFLDARYLYQALKINDLPLDQVRFKNKGIGFNLGYKITI